MTEHGQPAEGLVVASLLYGTRTLLLSSVGLGAFLPAAALTFLACKRR